MSCNKNKLNKNDITLEDVEVCIKVLETALNKFNRSLSVLCRTESLLKRMSTFDDIMRLIMQSAFSKIETTPIEEEVTPEMIERVKKLKEKYGKK